MAYDRIAVFHAPHLLCAVVEAFVHALRRQEQGSAPAPRASVWARGLRTAN